MSTGRKSRPLFASPVLLLLSLVCCSWVGNVLNRQLRLAKFRRFPKIKKRLVDGSVKPLAKIKRKSSRQRINRTGKKLDLSSKFHFFTPDTMILENSIFWQSVVFAIWGYLFAIFLNTLVGVPRRLIESA